MEEILNKLKTMDLTYIDKENSLKVTEDTEKNIAMLLEIETLMEQARIVLEQRFIELAKENKQLKKYEGSLISIGYSPTRRLKINGTVDPKFIKKIVKEDLDTKLVREFQETTGELPTGVMENVFEHISFKLN